MCVNNQGPQLDMDNGKQSLIIGSNNSQITWYVMLAINKSHCSIIHCKVSKNCNWNANQCKSILESSPAAAESESESESETWTWMIHATHANIQMQMSECKIRNAKIIHKCKFCECERPAVRATIKSK